MDTFWSSKIPFWNFWYPKFFGIIWIPFQIWWKIYKSPIYFHNYWSFCSNSMKFQNFFFPKFWIFHKILWLFFAMLTATFWFVIFSFSYPNDSWFLEIKLTLLRISSILVLKTGVLKNSPQNYKGCTLESWIFTTLETMTSILIQARNSNKLFMIQVNLRTSSTRHYVWYLHCGSGWVSKESSVYLILKGKVVKIFKTYSKCAKNIDSLGLKTLLLTKFIK